MLLKKHTHIHTHETHWMDPWSVKAIMLQVCMYVCIYMQSFQLYSCLNSRTPKSNATAMQRNANATGNRRSTIQTHTHMGNQKQTGLFSLCLFVRGCCNIPRRSCSCMGKYAHIYDHGHIHTYILASFSHFISGI